MKIRYILYSFVLGLDLRLEEKLVYYFLSFKEFVIIFYYHLNNTNKSGNEITLLSQLIYPALLNKQIIQSANNNVTLSYNN